MQKKKNCAYTGSALPLNSTGVDALKIWCSHLLPNNYAAGDDVNTCCDIDQVNMMLLSGHCGSLNKLNNFFSLNAVE